MPRELKERTISGTTYRVHQLGALQGRKVLARLGKVLAVVQSDKLESLLAEDEVDYLCDTFGRTTEVHLGDKWPQLSDVFDEHFAGRYADLLSWLMFALEVNFGSFFTEAVKKLEGFAATVKKSKSESTTPTGGSGES